MVGVILALAIAGCGTVVGFDRDRAFYPTVLIVVASYYSLFAVMGGSGTILAVEIGVGLGFSALAVLGFKRSMWLVAAGITGHGILDLFHHSIIENTGVPVWWPGFCAAIDIVLGGWLALLLRKRRHQALLTGSRETERIVQ